MGTDGICPLVKTQSTGALPHSTSVSVGIQWKWWSSSNRSDEIRGKPYPSHHSGSIFTNRHSSGASCDGESHFRTRAHAAIDRPGCSKADKTMGKAPRSLRCLKRSITRKVAREPRSGRHYEVDHQRPNHSTCNESLWLGNDRCSHRRRNGVNLILGFCYFWLNALRVNPDAGRPVSYDHCLA